MKNYKKFLELKKQIKKYAEGGKVESPHDKKNLQSLKTSFEKFIKEESKEKYSDGGQVQESQQKQYQAKDYFGKGSNAGGEGVANSMGIRMNQGGDTSSAYDELAKKLREAFSAPTPPPTPEETQEERYARIRRENSERATGKRASFSEGGSVGGSANTASSLAPLLKETYAGKVKQKKIPLNIPKAPKLKIPKRLGSVHDVSGYADGGFTQDPSQMSPEEYAQHLQDLKAQGIPVEHVEGDPQLVQASKLESQYIPEEEDANKAAGLTTDAGIGLLDRINNALGDKPAPDTRNLEGMTLNKEEALASEPGQAKLPEQEAIPQRARPDSDKAIDEAFAEESKTPNTKIAAEQSPVPKEPKEEETIKPYDPISALDKAQSSAHTSAILNQLGAISEKTAAGMAGIDTKYQDVYKRNAEISRQAVDDVKDRIKQQGDDPNSPISTSFKKYLAKFSGEPVSPNMTANAGKEVLPLVFKDYEAKLLQQTRKEMLEDKLNERHDTAAENRAAEERKYKFLADERKETAKEKALDREAASKLKTEEKQDQFDRKRLDALGKALTAETASSRSAFGRGANNVRSAEAIEALTDQFKGHLDQMDERQITELARSLDGLLAQGQPTISGTMHLIPKTAVGNVSKIVEYLRNVPTGQQQGAFVKRMLETVSREKELAKDQIKRVQGKVLGPYMETLKRRPDDARDILGPHGLEFLVDSKDKESKKEASSKSEEKQAKKIVVKKGYNAKTNQTQLIYDDGSKEIVDGRQ